MCLAKEVTGGRLLTVACAHFLPKGLVGVSKGCAGYGVYEVDDTADAVDAVEAHLARFVGEAWGIGFSSSASSSYLEDQIFTGDEDGKDMVVVENEERFSLALHQP